MRVLSAAEMAAVDRRAIDELGIPGPVLMENAAVGAVDAVCRHLPRARRLAIFCGPGNNGGDGLAMARHLDARGFEVRTFLVLGSSEPAGDAQLQLQILERAGRTVERLRDSADVRRALDGLASYDGLVDALFGTGLSRPLGGHFAELVEGFGGLGVPLIAVDLPSGLDGSRAAPIGPHPRADLTVTFAAPKIAHVLPPACDAMGELAIADLGIPPELVEEAPGCWHLLTREAMAAEMPLAPRGAHKGTFGHALLAGGGPGGAGAAVLAARAAVRSGAGLVTAAVPSRLFTTADAASPESMTLALPEQAGAVSQEAVAVLLEAAEGKRAVALGPGLGTAPQTVVAVCELVERLEQPLVLDADGLNALGDGVARLKTRTAATVLTPHPGEAARLLGLSVPDVEADRPAAALHLAAGSGAVVVLKGRRTLVAAPDGELWINPTGNPGMATGGSGDVLTGAIAALLAQGHGAESAARLGVYAHGLAGDLAADERGRAGLAAGDLADRLPEAWRLLEDAE